MHKCPITSGSFVFSKVPAYAKCSKISKVNYAALYIAVPRVVGNLQLMNSSVFFLQSGARLLVENPFVEHDNSSNMTAGRKKRPRPILV